MAEKLKIGEVAKMLDESVERIRKWCDDGKLNSSLSEGGHRLFDLSEVIKIKEEIKPSKIVDYVERAKLLRTTYKEKTASLKQELDKFSGDVTGINLTISQKIIKNTETNDIKKYETVNLGNSCIFIASYLEDDIFEFKCMPVYPEKTIIQGANKQLSALMGPISFEDKIIEVERMSNIKKGSLSDLLESLVEHISKL